MGAKKQFFPTGIKYKVEHAVTTGELVPLSEKRHRLYNSEIPEVILGLHLRLKQLLEKKEDAEKAETAYRCMHRLLAKNPGRPKYTKFSWEFITYIVEDGEEYLPTLVEEMRREKKATETNERS